MREPTTEHVRRQRLLLRDLQDDFPRFDRPQCDQNLRNSLYTRIEELKAELGEMERRLARRFSRGGAMEACGAD